MKDIRATTVQVTVREDRKVIWVNTEEGCVTRIQNIHQLVVDDPRGPLTELRIAARFAASVLKAQGLYDLSERLAFKKLEKALARVA